VERTLKDEPIQNALTSILKPLISWAIRVGYTYPTLCNLLKEIYVEVEKSSLSENEKPNISKISLSTGLHRKDVKSLLEQNKTHYNRKKRIPLKAQLFSAWLANDFSTDIDGEPIALPKTGHLSFETLVKTLSIDVAAGTVLKQALDQEYIFEMQDGSVCLNLESLANDNTDSEQLYYFKENISDHLSAAVHNISSDQDKFLERAVFFNDISRAEISNFQSEISELSNNLLFKVNKSFRDMENPKEDEPKYRVRLGLYYFHEEN
jgi:hypothetical protein